MVQTKKLWSYQVPCKDGESFPINSLEFNPDGTQIAIGVGPAILLYNPTNGDLLNSLKGHKGTVYTLSYNKDGSRFASGGADNCVIIWTKEGKGVLKYTHGDSVQVVLYNPVNEVLASCANSSFGFWSPNRKVVQKHKIESKISAAAWTDDGLFLAIGMISGKISIRVADTGNEKVSINRSAPIWGLEWKPKQVDDGDNTIDILVVSCWDKTISFYNLFGELCYNGEQSIDFYPCNISFLGRNTELMISSGSNKRTVLFNARDATKICDLTHGSNNWIWASKVNASCSVIATGDQGGEITVFSLQFKDVFSIDDGPYVCRDNMTDVVIKHIEKRQKILIRGRDLIKHISVYDNRFVMQLASDRICIYEESCDQDDNTLQYQMKEKIEHHIPCSMLSLTSNHIVLCHEYSLSILTFSGNVVRTTQFESKISCVKTISGPQSYEYILIGFDDGYIKKVLIDKSFPIDILQHSKEIRFLDFNWNRQKIGFIDIEGNFFVKGMKTKEELFFSKEVTSFAFNNDICDTICFTKNNRTLFVVSDKASVYSCRIDGYVVSFKASRIYIRHGKCFETLDIPQSNIVHHHVMRKEFHKAYIAACCGVPDHVWTMLATSAMTDLNFEIARKAFYKTKNIIYMELMNSTENELKHNSNNHSKVEKIKRIFQADMAILDGNYEDAVDLLTNCGEIERAIGIYIDLNLWDEAKKLCATKDMNINKVTRKQAEAEENANNLKIAAELYLECGDALKAVRIIGEGKQSDWKENLRRVAELLPSDEISALENCALFLIDSHEDNYAIEIYKKLKNYSKLIKVYTQRQEWAEIKLIIDSHISEVEKNDILPYAGWLSVNDNIEEALQIYSEVDSSEQGRQFIAEMIQIAIIENRFKDVAYYYYLLGTIETKNTGQDKGINNTYFYKCMKLSQLHHAYSVIYLFCKDPFTNVSPKVLLDTSIFVFILLGDTTFDNCDVNGIFQTFVLYVMAKNARIIGACNVAKFAYKRLSTFHIPFNWREKLTLETLLIQTTPIEDKEDLDLFCCRCGSYTSLLQKVQQNNSRNDSCDNCGHPFIRCSISFDILPLIEFQIDSNLSNEDALSLIRSPVKNGFSKHKCGDLFAECVTLALEKQEVTAIYEPVKVDENTFKALARTEVLVLMPLSPEMKIRFFKNMIPEIGVVVNQNCHIFVREDIYEFSCLKGEKCPYTNVEQIM